ncbi:S-adenosyl-l-methionine hydroxide adenosyltransferase family protein [Bacteroidota bacterium]
MAIITLTTDWKNNDFYIAAVKARILSICHDVNIVDISHSIPSFNTGQASFIIKNAYKYFPAGTVHIIGINSVLENGQFHIVVKAHGQYFIGTDNGIFALMFSENVDEIVRIDQNRPGNMAVNEQAEENTSHGLLFPELEVFTHSAAFLARGGHLDELGEKQSTFFRQVPIRATFEESSINGCVIYIDSYQNAISNISRELFYRLKKERPFEIFVQSNFYKINRINQTYNETSVGELLAVFNSLDLLEIAINKGNAAELLGLRLNSEIKVKFYDQA